MRFPKRRRAVSQSDVYCHKGIAPDDERCSKSQDWSLNGLVETSEVLLDERTSAKRFQQLYSHLKFAHTQLQESHAELELRYTDSLHEWLNEKKLMKAELARLSAEKHELELLCFELQKSALSPEILELLKYEIKNELRKKSEDEIARTTEEFEAVRTECLNVTRQLENLKVEYEQFRVHSKTAKEREFSLLELERQRTTELQEETINRLSSLLGSDTETLADLYRKNSHIRAQYHLVVGEAERSKRLYDTQMCELKNDLIRTVEELAAAKTERATLVTKCASLSEEVELFARSLASAHADLKAARQRIVDCERSRLSSEKHLEGRMHYLMTELNNYRLTAHRERVEIEHQRDQLASQVQELTNQMALSVAKFDEAEALHQRREQEMMQRESDLRKTMIDSTEEFRKRSAEMLRQLECAHSRLRGLTAQHKDITRILAELETLKSETQKKLSLSEEHNFSLKEELAMIRQELTVRRNQIQCLEGALKEITSADDELPEKDVGDEGGPIGRITSIREAYLRLLKKFKIQSIKLTEKISQINAELIAKSYEAEQHRKENEKLRDFVPQAEYQRVKSQLKEFQRQKDSYRFLLHQGSQILPGGRSV